jgi:serine/threonine protein kinase
MWSGPDVARNRSVILGKYRLLGELGQGGMADVYLGTADGPAGFSKLIVIKRLRNLDDPQHMAMFLDEARIARRLSHPNIVGTYEIGQDAGAHFIVMEYLHGPTLHRLRRSAASQRGLPWAIEIEIHLNVLEGLHYAHELKTSDGRPLHVVHRDLSPENVIVTQLGESKILDFGIAKAVDSVSHTQAGFYKGKLKNMPPEQLRGERVDRRADVYAAGVMLWEGLSGRLLWGDLGNAAIATRLAQGDLPALQENGPGVPRALRELCAKALSPDPEQRYATALEFKEALASYVQKNDLVVTRPELANFVEPLFAEERERINRIIQMQPLQSEHSLVLMSSVGASPVPPPPSDDTVLGRTPFTRNPASTPVALGVPAGGGGFTGWVSSRLLVLAGVAAVLAVGAVAATRVARSPAHLDVPADKPAPPAPPAAAVVPPPAPPVEHVANERPPAEPVETPPPDLDDNGAPGNSRRPSRGRPARPRPPAALAAPRETPRPAVQVDVPLRWNGRRIDVENPYGGNSGTAAPASPPTIDRNNPWKIGDSQ